MCDFFDCYNLSSWLVIVQQYICLAPWGQKEDYKNIILPAVKHTEFAKEKLSSAEVFKYTEKEYGEDAVGLRWSAYCNWDYDEFSSALERVRHEVEHDFARFGEDVTDVEVHNDLSILDLNSGCGSLPYQTYQDNYERIILNLARYMAKHGTTNRDIIKIAEGESGPNHVFGASKVMKHLLKAAKQ